MYILIFAMTSVEAGLVLLMPMMPKMEVLGAIVSLGIILAFLWWKYVPPHRRL